MKNAMEAADALLGRLKLGREEFCQRLLTMLILDADYPRWNTRSHVSAGGARFLEELDALSFASSSAASGVTFVDEFDLPRRNDAEKGSAPDWAVLTEDRVWMIELKTEAASHRAAQIPGYFELARHYYPKRAIDLTYLTPPLSAGGATLGQSMRFAHVVWGDVLPLIEQVWSSGTEWQQDTVSVLVDALDGIGTSWTKWRSLRLARAEEPAEPTLADLVSESILVGRGTAIDGRQRALEYRAADLEELQSLRMALNEALVADGDPSTGQVRSWLWNAETSGGSALTAAGRQTGYELRFSRYGP
jgi:hypothetical protein